MWNQILSEAVLVYRTYAIYGNKLPLLAFLVLCLASVAGFQIYVIATGMSRKSPSNQLVVLTIIRFERSIVV